MRNATLIAFGWVELVFARPSMILRIKGDVVVREISRPFRLSVQCRIMGGLPTLGEFKTVLRNDPIFCDYFNAFLNLPVSNHRNLIAYRSMSKHLISRKTLYTGILKAVDIH